MTFACLKILLNLGIELMNTPTILNVTSKSRNAQVIALDSRKSELVTSDKKFIKILQLSDLLSRTLEITDVISSFSGEIQNLIPHNAYRFISERVDAPVSMGNVDRFSLHYRITLREQLLGEITIYRNSRFSTNEVCEFEDYLCGLVYPVKNALMYQTALKSAYVDPLTHLGNRTAMEKFLPREIGLVKRHEHSMAMMVMDLDGFKVINDLCGHDAGDRVLQDVGVVLQEAVRNTDLLYRYGGDEFVSALPQTDMQGALDVAERVRLGIDNLTLPDCDPSIEISVSIGVTMVLAGDDFKRSFKRADKALYKAKKAGKNRIIVG